MPFFIAFLIHGYHAPGKVTENALVVEIHGKSWNFFRSWKKYGILYGHRITKDIHHTYC